MKKSILSLEGVTILSREERKLFSGGRKSLSPIAANTCVSSSTCTQGCEIIDSDGCSECSGCCIA